MSAMAWSDRVKEARARLEGLRALAAPERHPEEVAVGDLFVALAREAAGLEPDVAVQFDPSISGAHFDAHGALRVGTAALDPARPRLRGLVARTGPASEVEPEALAGDLLGWSVALDRGTFEPRDGRALIDAARRLLERLPARPDRQALSALAALAGLARNVPPGPLRGELRTVVRATTADRVAVIEGQGDRPLAARFALAVAVALEGTGLLVAGDLSLQVATLLGEAPAPEAPVMHAETARLEEALGEVVRAVSEGDVEQAAKASRALADASAEAELHSPAMARAVVKLGFARAAARVVDPAALRRLGEAFRPVLAGEALHGTPLAEVLRSWSEAEPVTPGTETGDPVVDALAERLFRRGDALEAASPLMRRPALADALLGRVERRLTRFTLGSRAIDSALRLGLFAEDKLTRFDRRFRALEALLSASDEAGSMGLFSDFDGFGELSLDALGELTLPTIQSVGGDGASLGGGFGGFGGFGGLGGLGGMGGMGGGDAFAKLDPKTLAAIAMSMGGGAGGAGALGALGGGKLSKQMLQALARLTAGRGPAGGLAALLGGGRGGLASLLQQPALLRALSGSVGGGGLGGFSFSSLSRAGSSHLALGLGGGLPTGFSPGLSSPGGSRGALLLPSLGKQSFAMPRGQALAGLGGFSFGLPGSLRGSSGSSALGGGFRLGSQHIPFSSGGAGGSFGGSFGGSGSFGALRLPGAGDFRRGASAALPSFGSSGSAPFGSLAGSSAPRAGASFSGQGRPSWFGVPTRGQMFDFSLDGFGRPRMSSMGSGSSAWLGGSGFGSLPSSASFRGAGGFSLGTVGGGGFRGALPSFSGAQSFGAQSFGAQSFGAQSFGAFGAAPSFRAGPSGAPGRMPTFGAGAFGGLPGGALGAWRGRPVASARSFAGFGGGGFASSFGGGFPTSFGGGSFPSFGGGAFPTSFGGGSFPSFGGGRPSGSFPSFGGGRGAASFPSFGGGGSFPSSFSGGGVGGSFPSFGGAFPSFGPGGVSFPSFGGGGSFPSSFSGGFGGSPSFGGGSRVGGALPRGWAGGGAPAGSGGFPRDFGGFGGFRSSQTALGLDLRIAGAGRVPMFPGSGLSWRAMSVGSAPAPALRALRSASMPTSASGWRGFMASFGGSAGAGRMPSSGSMSAGYSGPGVGIPAGFTRGLSTGTSGFSAPFRLPTSGRAPAAAFMPAFGDLRLQAASALPLPSMGGAFSSFPGMPSASAGYMPSVRGGAGAHARSQHRMPSFGGFGGAPSFGGFGGAPSFGGFGGAPSFGGFGGAPSFGGFGGAPSFGGFGGAPSFGAQQARFFSQMPFSGGPSAGGGFGAPASFGSLDLPFRLPAAGAASGAWARLAGSLPSSLQGSIDFGSAGLARRLASPAGRTFAGAGGTPSFGFPTLGGGRGLAAARSGFTLPGGSSFPGSSFPGVPSFAPGAQGGFALPRGGWSRSGADALRAGRLPAWGAGGMTMPASLPGWQLPLDGLVGGAGLHRPSSLFGGSSPTLGGASFFGSSPLAGAPRFDASAFGGEFGWPALGASTPDVGFGGAPQARALPRTSTAGWADLAPGLDLTGFGLLPSPQAWSGGGAFPARGLPGAPGIAARAFGDAFVGRPQVGGRAWTPPALGAPSARGASGTDAVPRWIADLGLLGFDPASLSSIMPNGRPVSGQVSAGPDGGRMSGLRGLMQLQGERSASPRVGALELPRMAVPFPAPTPGADLSRHLMGQPVRHGGQGGMQLGRYDELAFSRSGDGGLMRPGGWRALAAHELARPAVGLRDATRASRGRGLPARLQQALAQRGLRGEQARSVLDLAGLSGGPRLIPGVTDPQQRLASPGGLVAAGRGPRASQRGAAPGGRGGLHDVAGAPRAELRGRASALTSMPSASPRRPGLPSMAGRPRLGRAVPGAQVAPDLGSVRGQVMPGWQSLAADQLDGRDPVFAYGPTGAAAEPSAMLRPLATRAELVSPASLGGSYAPGPSGAGSALGPFGLMPLAGRAGGDGAALLGAFNPRLTRDGDRGLVERSMIAQGLAPRLAARAGASLAFAGGDDDRRLALPVGVAGRVGGWSSFGRGGFAPGALSGPTAGDARPIGGRVGAPSSRLAASPEQVLPAAARRSSAPTSFDPASFGLLGQGPRARGGSGLGWLAPAVADRAQDGGASVRDPSLALPPGLREFVRGGAAPSSMRLATEPAPTTQPGAFALPSGAAPTGAAGPATGFGSGVSTELVRPVGLAPGAPSSSSPGSASPGSAAATTRQPYAAPTAPPFGPIGSMQPRRSAALARAASARFGPTGSSPDMEHTNLVAGVAGGGVLRKQSAADAEGGGDSGKLLPSKESSTAESGVPSSPADLSLLVNQIYAQLKRELLIERERKG